MSVLLSLLSVVFGLLLQPTMGEAQVKVYVENPTAGSSQSGIGVISGWLCQAQRVDIDIDGRATLQAAYGTARPDTQRDCGDIDNGFGLLMNWNLLGDGPNHRIRVLADGTEVASVTFTVVTLGLGDFPRGLSGMGTISNFPQAGRSTQLQWQESLQNFTIANPSGNSTGSGANSPGAYLENPTAGSSQSGIGVISGWLCQAQRVDIDIDGRATLQAAYGTARPDTQRDCGDIDNGFGLLMNWNLLGDGPNHRIRVLADGTEVASVTFTVVTLGLGDFPRGLSGMGTISNFPQAGRSTQLQWQESLQNFAITQVTPGPSTNAPQLVISTTSLDFGDVATGTIKDEDFSITNSGGGTLTGTVTVAAPFSVVTGGTFNLAAGQTQTVTIRFTASTPGPISATATCSSNGGSATLSLTGNGVIRVY